MTGSAVVIDDNPEVGQQLAGILTRLGLTVKAVCESGSTGLTAIMFHEPTIATIDNQMPDMNGVEVIAAVRKTVVSTKLVMCSGTRSVEKIALWVGADAFIIKPYDQVLIERDFRTLLGGDPHR